MDYWKILELKEGSSSDEIKKAYRTLAKKYHPDHNKSLNASKKFLEIQKAYEYLINNPACTYSQSASKEYNSDSSYSNYQEDSHKKEKRKYYSYKESDYQKKSQSSAFHQDAKQDSKEDYDSKYKRNYHERYNSGTYENYSSSNYEKYHRKKNQNQNYSSSSSND